MIKDEKKQFYTTEQLSEHMAETPEGFLVCYDVPVARTGNQDYKADEVPIEPNKDGMVTIQRDEAEVFEEKTIKSFEGKPVTIDHPEGMVTPENWTDLAHGFLQNVRRGVREQADLLLADIVITTKKAIELVKNGLRQVSCGYDAEYEQIKEGLGKQTQIVGNHVALVMRGRAGARCAIGDKECTNCGKCKNLQEDKMRIRKRIKDALLKAVDAIPDDELEKEQEAKDAAEVAKVEELEALDRKIRDAEEDLEYEELEKDAEAKVEELKALDRKIKDAEEEDLEYEELEKDAEAKVEELKALDRKIRDKKRSRDQDEEKPWEKEETEDADDDLKATVEGLVQTVGTLQKAIETLIQSDKKVHAGVDKKAKDQDPDEEEEEIKDQDPDEEKPWEKKSEDQDPDEEEEEVKDQDPDEEEEEIKDQNPDEEGSEEKKKMEAMDCVVSWNDIAYRSDLLAPGHRYQRPTKDHKRALEGIKRSSLRTAFTSDKDMGKIFNKNVNTLSGKMLDEVFKSASEFIRLRNNSFVKDSIQQKTATTLSEVQAINKMNREHWKNR